MLLQPLVYVAPPDWTTAWTVYAPDCAPSVVTEKRMGSVSPEDLRAKWASVGSECQPVGSLSETVPSAAACVCTVTLTGSGVPSSGARRASGVMLTPMAGVTMSGW